MLICMKGALLLAGGACSVDLSENVVSTPINPMGFADHYPVFEWLFHWEYTLFSDKPIFIYCIHSGEVVGLLMLGFLISQTV